jgi:hypothetical protein
MIHGALVLRGRRRQIPLFIRSCWGMRVCVRRWGIFWMLLLRQRRLRQAMVVRKLLLLLPRQRRLVEVNLLRRPLPALRRRAAAVLLRI